MVLRQDLIVVHLTLFTYFVGSFIVVLPSYSFVHTVRTSDFLRSQTTHLVPTNPSWSKDRFCFLSWSPRRTFLNADSNAFLADDEQEWLSDAELIRRATQTPGGEALTNRDRNTFKKFISADADSSGVASPLDGSYGGNFPNSEQKNGTERNEQSGETDKEVTASIHKQEKEELIRDFGGLNEGRTASIEQKREEGYFVDSTLIDIARDYAIPICYLGDVLISWGVPPPIDPHHTPVKDMITGEHAFSLLEALLSLDPTSLNERYSSDTLEDLCYEYDDMFDLSEALNFCIQEGYNLPFGIQTCLRVEQEEELLRVLAPLD